MTKTKPDKKLVQMAPKPSKNGNRNALKYSNALIQQQKVYSKRANRKTNNNPVRQSQNANSSSANSDNRYAILTDNESEIDMGSPNVNVKRIKTPPIVITDMAFNDIKKIMNDASIVNYHVKYISMGIKILTETIDDYRVIINLLKSKQVQYYTHDVQAEKLTKFVLSGLPNLPVEEVKAGLSANNIVFVDVKQMKTKNLNKNHALYLVYFTSKSVKLNELRAIKYVLNIVVNWKPYISARNGPTQCNNCQLYGHGSRNCAQQSRCAKCGGKHHTSACTRELEHPICCLCKEAHSSRDRNCPKRVNYIQMKLSHSTKNNNKAPSSKQTSTRQPAFQVTHEQFPPLKASNNRNWANWSSQDPNESTNSSPVINNGSLFSTQELLDLTKELILGLKNCRTKIDQFEVITQLAIKFISV